MMGPSKERQPRFEIDARVVYQLGEELISDEVQALLELIKNSYDADADYANITVVTRELAGDNSLHFPKSVGYIIVEDDGVGMDRDEIETAWLTISASPKRQMKAEGRTTAKGRTPVGDKGLGRLGSQRLGRNIEMWTTKAESRTEWYVGIDWGDFAAGVLSEAPVRWKATGKRDHRSGTRIIVSDLRSPQEWEGKAQDRLVRKLSEIIFPFGEVRPFEVYVSINGRRVELERITEAILDVAPMQFRFRFDGDTLSTTGRYRPTALLEPTRHARSQFQRLIQQDRGAGFYSYLVGKDNRRAAPVLEWDDEPGWFASFSQEYSLNDLGEVELVGTGELRDERAGDDSAQEIANPGPFHGRIHSFGYRGADLSGLEWVFDKQAEFSLFLGRIAGIRVFRDGFGMRPFGIDGNDWLDLGSGWTSAPSFYGLRPRNVVGYVALSAERNRRLQEATDREGFVESPYSRNFLLLMRQVVKSINDTNTRLRRGYNEYAKMRAQEELGIAGESTDEVVAEMRRASRAVQRLEPRVTESRTGLDALSSEVTSLQNVVARAPARQKREQEAATRALGEIDAALRRATGLLAEIEPVLADAKRLGNMADILQADLTLLRDQIVQFSELAGLGLTAEALSHEISIIADRLAARTRALLKELDPPVDPGVVAFTEHVHTAVGRLRKQLRHLDPSMRYAREKHDRITLRAFFDDLRDFYSDRFARKNIKMIVGEPFQDFAITMNRGKLTQIVDNILLNAEYWLSEDLRKQAISEASIIVRAKAPMVEIYDTGRGVSPSVEHHLFEPFVTTKPGGRGLGLFIARQLLDSSGCVISLLPDRNEFNRRYIFRIDFTGALHD